MKSRIYLSIVFLLSLFIFNSCTDDETAPDPNATFTASLTTARVGEFIQFTNTSTNATAFRWSFGDGTTSTEISPKKTYLSSGVFTVSLVSTGKGGSVIQSMEVTITADAFFVVENESDLQVLTPVKFTNLSKGATSYEWSFGNAGNSTSTAENPEFIYLTPGTYTVTLKAITAQGSSEFERDVVIKPSASGDVYFIEFGADPVFIRRLTLDGSGTVSDFLNVNDMSGVCMTYNEETGKVYFSGLDPDSDGKIWSINLDGTGLTPIVSGLWDPYGLSVDKVNGKLYWADDADGDDIGRIYRANLDGTNVEPLIEMEGAGFRAVSVDPENNKMYYQEVNGENIYVANLDGTNETILIPGAWGYALIVDTEHDKLYYEDNRVLKSANLNGTNIQIVDNAANLPATTQTRIYGMAIDYAADKLYWAGRDSGSILRSNLDGTGKEVLKSSLSSPRGIFLRK